MKAVILSWQLLYFESDRMRTQHEYTNDKCKKASKLEGHTEGDG